MNTAWIIFWAALILASIAWYGFLVIYIGIRAGRDIKALIKSLSDDHRSDTKS